ncbi:MAG TPA: PadR family transcriptional regulator [Vicinamibacteria bacterium]|nr:PadR family transcriptional regulator [Vicinamibacteria bacterium]
MGRSEAKFDLLPGTLELLILRSLERAGGPVHGYGIARFIKSLSNDVLQVEEGSLYPALQRLLLKGLLKAEWGQSENNRRARFYRLTPLGRKELQRGAADFERLLEGILRLMRPARGRGVP